MVEHSHGWAASVGMVQGQKGRQERPLPRLGQGQTCAAQWRRI